MYSIYRAEENCRCVSVIPDLVDSQKKKKQQTLITCIIKSIPYFMRNSATRPVNQIAAWYLPRAYLPFS